MPELLVALDAFMQEHRRCGELDGGVDQERVWMACDCGAGIAHPILPPSYWTDPQSSSSRVT